MDFTHKISLKEKLMFKLTRTQKIVATTGIVGGAVAAVYLGRKYDALIDSAKEAGVNEWLREMADKNLTMLVVTQDLAERMFEAAQDIAINERFTTVPR